MSAYFTPPESLPSGSIVDRATAILEKERAIPPRHQSAAGSPFDASSLGLGDIEKRIEHVRNQIQALVDAFTHLGEKLPSLGLAGAPLPLAAPAPSSVRLDGTALPVLRNATAPIGEVARTALGLVNGLASSASVALRATSLVNDLGEEIPASLVSFVPNEFSAPAGAETPVQVAVRIPSNARPGTYTGLIQAVGLAATRAVMVVDVVGSRGTP
jgi:hypothetical protein